MGSNEEISKKVLELYTPLSVAKKEIWRRWNDKALRKKVENFLGGDVPDIFKDKPKAVIFRNIATPNFEMGIAYEYACMMGLDLVIIEYTADKFCTRNRDKLHLGKMMFFNNDDNLRIVSKKKIVSIKEVDNKCLNEIKTLWGEGLVSFHHRIFDSSDFPKFRTFDASVYKKAGFNPHEIYLKIFSICSYSAILLENFLVKSDKGEREFTEEIIIPAFSDIEKKFGFRPLIVSLLDTDEDGSIFWQYYPEKIKEYIH
ncbi:MAG: hypothetical protein QG620_291 [Patescibacteria group bacterium]|nr:hypothetical protein [Patescibacteria group bacterium]